ncbi:VWA domain-containing protein [Tunturiibacter gelidoferens]|jgi:VWFA-related protein|uniref:VWFA-related protein n=1 Tax=Tunturiibacter gelidiferens TaxID=3069689 RepID=A0A9X0QB37_9BACT|nr:VWA domain-containing protein [Edaphobacter lichenicola]MBB5327033.1 VWFA-related protein [Edaphobacter lichenicola]
MRTLLPVLLFCATLPVLAQTPSPTDDQSYTLKTQSNVVLVPTTVQTKHGEMIYELKPEQFVVEDNGVSQTVHVDEDTDSLGLSLVVVVQCSRAAGYEYPKLGGLGAMIDGIAGDAPREVAIVTYGSAPLLLGKFSNSVDAMARALAQLEPCDDPEASTLDAVAYATRLLEARQNHYRHAILLISETRDHGSTAKPAEVVAALGRTNTVVDSVAFGPGKTEVMSDLKYGGGSGPIGLLVMAVNALKKNAAHELAALSGGEYINFTTQRGFDEGLHQLSNHVHNYYLLSFQPHAEANGEPASGMHRIRVRIPDYPDARVRFRESYFAGELDSTAANVN